MMDEHDLNPFTFEVGNFGNFEAEDLEGHSRVLQAGFQVSFRAKPYLRAAASMGLLTTRQASPSDKPL